MTTFVPFQPSPQQAFQFQAQFSAIAGSSLAGGAYNVIVTWLLGGARWYVNIYDQNNNWIVTTPLIGSPAAYDISLIAGYFASTLVYRQATQTFEIGP